MGFAVVIPTHRRVALLERTLSSIAASRIPDDLERVVVLENGCNDGVRQLCRSLSSRIPIEYHHRPDAGKGRALQWFVEQLANGFMVFHDDDIRIADGLLEAYASAARTHGPGHFFGGPLQVDYEDGAAPEEWLRRFLPGSVKGWSPRDPQTPLRGDERFRGANFAAFAEDVLEVGGFMAEIGPGSHLPGTEGNPTGLEHELQHRLLAAGKKPVYLEDAVVWHWVPGERSTERWALHRGFRNALSLTFRKEQVDPEPGARILGVPTFEWGRYVRAAIRAAAASIVPRRELRFTMHYRFHHQRGVIHGYRATRLEAEPVVAAGRGQRVGSGSSEASG